MKQNNALGISTVHIDVKEVASLGFSRMEIGLGRQGAYEDRFNKVMGEIDHAEKSGLPYSIHLPIYLYDWYKGDYLDAFYLDPDPEKRKMSYDLLEKNLKALKETSAEYFVMHFQGIYLETYMEEEAFYDLLVQSLDRINDLAQTYEKRILLEYFGSNIMFSDYRLWTDLLESYSHLGILMDTGHLYYASLLHNFDFDEGFDHLTRYAEAYHFWTTQGDAPYSESTSYKKYHHISARPGQLKVDGWAFDTEVIFKRLLTYRKPIVLEATPIYEGMAYFYDSIEALQNFVEID